MFNGRLFVSLAFVAFVAALVGVFAGRLIFERQRHNETELHALLHSQLSLNTVQETAIETVESRFAVRRTALDLEMRAANARLAAAIEAEHGYGPQVTLAVDHVHVVMGEMQKDTLRHIFAMRAVLTPEQAAKFDRSVVKALVPEGK
ncbi:MAG: periplasmic heavy metal sensor [Croceibacterium sp.]